MIVTLRRAVGWLAFMLLCLIAQGACAQERAAPALASLQREVVMVRMSDGADIALAIYHPREAGKSPALLAASPYRLDNDDAPSLPVFPFRETGPIAWYVEHGYTYVRMDVRGTGRSGGEYRYQDAREQKDLYEVVEWIASQPWSNGRVGGVGQSYYARSQWFMAAQAPPHLACIAPYDGNIDTYNASAYQGGVPGGYPGFWFNYVRGLNLAPHNGEPRDIPWDYSYQVGQHRLYDDFWRERSAAPQLSRVRIPVFSIGVWGKVDLHLNGNVVGYQLVSGPKKLLILGGAGVDAAVAEYSSIAFHEKYLLPFYDWCLKGLETTYVSEPEVRYTVTGSNRVLSSASWPPADVQHRTWFLGAGPSGSVTSLNDGALTPGAPKGTDGQTTLRYPDPEWSQSGVAVRGPGGAPDPARRVLTFTSAPFDEDATIAGPILFKAYVTSSRDDAGFFVSVYEQSAQADEQRQKGLQPAARLLTKGWLRASHRAIDPALSRPDAPWYAHTGRQPLVPGEVYALDIAVMPTAALIRKGSRLRLNIANSDSALIEGVFSHPYNPDQVGSYAILHDAEHPSALRVPILQAEQRPNEPRP